jgi:hypothetical protein
MPATGSLASWAPDKVLLGLGRCRSPLWGEGREDLTPLRGGKLAREGFSPTRERMAYQRRLVTLDRALEHVARGSCQDPRVTPQRSAWEMHGRSPLRRACIRHHYRARGGNDGLDRLVKSHRRSAPGGAKGQLVA